MAAADALQGSHVVLNDSLGRLGWMGDAMYAYQRRCDLWGRWGVDPDRWLSLCESVAQSEQVAVLLRLLLRELYLGNSAVGRTLRARTSPMVTWSTLSRDRRRLAGVVASHGRPVTTHDVGMVLRGAGLQVSDDVAEQQLAVLEREGVLRQDGGSWSVVPTFYNLARSADDLTITEGVETMHERSPPSRVPDPNGVIASASRMIRFAVPLAADAGIEIGQPIVMGNRGFMWPIRQGGRTVWIFFSRVRGTVHLASSPDGEATEVMSDLVAWVQEERSHRSIPADKALEAAFVVGLERVLGG